MFDAVKLALREPPIELFQEIQGLIDAARADLMLSGVSGEKANSDNDPLIKRAIIIYCRAHFDYHDASAERLLQSYNLLKSHLSLAEDYKASS